MLCKGAQPSLSWKRDAVAGSRVPVCLQIPGGQVVVPGGPTEFHGTKRYPFKKWQVAGLEPMDPTSGERERARSHADCAHVESFIGQKGERGERKGDL